MKILVSTLAVGTALLAAASQTFAAVYEIPAADMTALSATGGDTATSMIGVFTDVLPIAVPIIAVLFAISFVRGYLRTR